jgi:signal transduction histidine kinase/DNA-binding NarL/FixJ family response regulator
VIHLLLIAEESLAGACTASLSASPDHKLVRKDDLSAAAPLLDTGVFDLVATINAPGETTVSRLAAIRSAAGEVPLVLITTDCSATMEQAAYAAGADLVLRAPVTSDAFIAATRRLLAAHASPTEAPARTVVANTAAPIHSSSLEVLRDFSRVLGYSLDYKLFTQHFVLKLREILSVNRIAIFLESPPATTPSQSPDPRGKDRLAAAAAVGVAHDLIECIELSRRSGIGLQVTRNAQILRIDTDISATCLAQDPKIRREFEILGCQVALPINDRERTLGVALIGGRVTGGPLNDAELQLVYHLLEELGLAVKNSWLHHQLSASHRLFSDVLGAITSGSLVIGADLAVLHANRAFLQFLRGAVKLDAHVDFSELPGPLAAALHDLSEKGVLADPFFITSAHHPGRTYRVSLIPFPNPDRRLPQPALALIEDFTQILSAQRAEIATSNAKLIALIARRFAHEIRNSLVPLSTHHQLLDTDYANEGFRDSLKEALGRETARIQRFTEQMLFLSQPPYPADSLVPLAPLLRDAFKRANDSLGLSARLEITGVDAESSVRAHRASLMHALEEIFLNALQETIDQGPVSVHAYASKTSDGQPGITLAFSDPGEGIAPEVALRATEPFFTTRNTGVGLGLTVARRIVENHSGILEVRTRTAENDADILLHLPVF